MKIFCDLDGTIIDSSKRHVLLLERLLKDNEIRYAKEQLALYMPCKAGGKGTRAFLTDILGLDSRNAAQIAEKWAENIENAEYLRYDLLYDDSIAALSAMREMGDVFFLTARKNGKGLYHTMERLGIDRYARCVFVVSPYHATDNKYEAVRAIVSHDDILIGDTEADLNAAGRLGISCYMLNRGFRSEAYWREINVKSYDGLLEVLDSIQSNNVKGKEGVFK